MSGHGAEQTCRVGSFGPEAEKQTCGSMMLNDVTIVREEVLFQISFHVNPAATELSGVNVMHHDGISSPISLVHQQTTEILQMQAQVLGKISNFVNVQGSVRSLIAYAESQF